MALGALRVSLIRWTGTLEAEAGLTSLPSLRSDNPGIRERCDSECVAFGERKQVVFLTGQFGVMMSLYFDDRLCECLRIFQARNQ